MVYQDFNCIRQNQYTVLNQNQKHQFGMNLYKHNNFIIAFLKDVKFLISNYN